MYNLRIVFFQIEVTREVNIVALTVCFKVHSVTFVVYKRWRKRKTNEKVLYECIASTIVYVFVLVQIIQHVEIVQIYKETN